MNYISWNKCYRNTILELEDIIISLIKNETTIYLLNQQFRVKEMLSLPNIYQVREPKLCDFFQKHNLYW